MTPEDKGSTFFQNASFWLPTHAMWQFKQNSQLLPQTPHSSYFPVFFTVQDWRFSWCPLWKLLYSVTWFFFQPKYISPRLHGVTPKKSTGFTVTTKPWLKWRAGFDTMSIHMGFVVDKASEKRIFLQVLLFLFYGTTSQLGPWPLQSSTSRHLYPPPTVCHSCISTSSCHPCPMHLTISLWTFPLVFSFLCNLSMLPWARFHP